MFVRMSTRSRCTCEGFLSDEQIKQSSAAKEDKSDRRQGNGAAHAG